MPVHTNATLPLYMTSLATDEESAEEVIEHSSPLATF